jgi:hypothetical protein
MKAVSIVVIVICVAFLIIDAATYIMGHYQYTRQYEAYWNLADKASTIQQKSDYIDKYVEALENSNMKGQYNAVFLETPDNSFDNNLAALKSLQLRLREIKNMDVTSFQYQTAIQQITAQEQGEAEDMNSVFQGVWWKTYHFFLWDWVGALNIIYFIFLGICFCIVLAYESDFF